MSFVLVTVHNIVYFTASCCTPPFPSDFGAHAPLCVCSLSIYEGSIHLILYHRRQYFRPHIAELTRCWQGVELYTLHMASPKKPVPFLQPVKTGSSVASSFDVDDTYDTPTGSSPRIDFRGCSMKCLYNDAKVTFGRPTFLRRRWGLAKIGVRFQIIAGGAKTSKLPVDVGTAIRIDNIFFPSRVACIPSSCRSRNQQEGECN